MKVFLSMLLVSTASYLAGWMTNKPNQLEGFIREAGGGVSIHVRHQEDIPGNDRRSGYNRVEPLDWEGHANTYYFISEDLEKIKKACEKLDEIGWHVYQELDN